MDLAELEQLRQSERGYRNLAERSIQGIFVHDEVGQALYANPAFARMLGYGSPTELLELDLSEDPLVAVHDRERLAGYTRARLAGGAAPSEYEFDALACDGGLRRLRAQVAPIEWQGRRAVVATMVDVTAQRAAEERFRTLVEGSIHGIAILDLEWRPLFVNEAYAELFGYDSPAEILAMDSVEGLIDPEDVERMRSYARARGAGRPAPEIYEFRGLCRDGSRRPLLNAAHRIEWHGQPALQVTMTDLTELRVAERALRESERRAAQTGRTLQLVLDTIPDRVSWKDREGRFIGCNRRFAADAGFERPGELVGLEDTDPAWAGIDRNILASGEPVLGLEQLLAGPGDGERWVRASRVPLRDAADEIIGVLGTYQDVTDEKRAQQALRASEERYALAVRGSTDGIWDWDIERRTLYYSPRLRELLGFAAERETQDYTSVLGRIHEEDRDRYRQALVAHLRGETEVFRCEFRVHGDDGAERWVLDRGVALRDDSGQAYRMAGSVVDITELRRVEEELARHRDRLEELVAERTEALRAAQADLLRAERLATLGELTAAVSHELRNPLGTIHASLESLRRRSSPEDTSGQRALARIERSIARCVQVIEDLLGYARLREPVRRIVGLDDVVAQALERRPPGPGVAIEADLASGVRVAVDEELVLLALEHLLRNAEQAFEARAEGRIEVRTRRWDRGAAIVVADDGPGIEPGTRERIFEPLFSTRSFGVGLGLPVAQHILEQHGGRIDVPASSDEGTTVRLWLPEADQASNPA